MGKTTMNRRMGTKWYTFYTKVRTVFAIIAGLALVGGFTQYIDWYLSYWWMLLYIVFGIIGEIFAVRY